MQAKMQVIRGAKTKEIRLRLPSVIGRGGGSKIKLPASTVSRHHCELYEFEGQIVVRDLGSSNGTVVNGHKIKGPTFLTAEDELTIGPVTVRLSEVATAPESTYSVAPAEEAAPSFDDLPMAETPPVVASEGEHSSVVDSEAPTGTEGDESVLQYAEPKSTGRSFVGIAPNEETSPNIVDVPVFDGADAADQPEVKTDDSALNSFFKNLDN